MTTLHDFTVKTIDGSEKPLSQYAGQVLLIVNVASRCGFTPHYTGLEALYRSHHARGLTVLGFPCNQFGGQEPGTEAEIKSFCESKYDITFPLFAKVDVNGPHRDPAFAFLTSQPTSPDGPGDIPWNFTKFVVGRDGRVVARFTTATKPDAPELVAAVEKALG